MPATPLTAKEKKQNNLPDVLVRWKKRDGTELNNPRTAQSFCVPKSDIVTADYDLSLNRYKEVEHDEVEYDPPAKIIAELRAMEKEISDGLTKLEEMLG